MVIYARAKGMLRTIAIFMTALAAVVTVTASTADASPRAYVDRMARAAQGVIEKTETSLGVDEVAQFDMEAFSRRCMVDHWDDLSEEQRQEFVAVFSISLKGRLEKLMRKRMNGRRFRYIIGEARRGRDGVIEVPMTAKVDDVQLAFTYSLIRKGDTYKLVDYEVDGVLLSRNYRGQFNYLMRRHGYEGMIERMREKNELIARR